MNKFPGYSLLELTVYGLCKQDLIRTKLLCLFDEFGRETSRDIQQLKQIISSTDEALNEALWVLSALSTWEPGRYTLEEVRQKIIEGLK